MTDTTDSHGETGLEAQIALWRSYLRRRAIHTSEVDADELEDHLRAQITALTDVGLSPDEAFLIAIKRIGNLDALSREYAREYSERLWKQLVLASDDQGALQSTGSAAAAHTEAVVAVALAIVAGIAIKVPELFGLSMQDETNALFYIRNASLFVLPVLTGYFVWKRGLNPARRPWLALPFVAAAVVVNVIPFTPGGPTEVLASLHLPIALWMVVGVAYASGDWRHAARRMDFVRFSGELFIYYALMAFGGGVLTACTMLMFAAIGLDVSWMAQRWILPCGALGAVIIGAWLVEAKQSVIENMAPVLTRLFTPLFAAAFLAFLGTMVWTRTGIDVEREVLIGFDLLLVLVLGLLLYAISARDPRAKPNAFDALQLVLVVSA